MAPSRSLVPLLLVLTFASGALDAFAFLHLGQLFVANQTGNVMLLAISIPSNGSATSTSGSLISLVAFLLGALAGGRLTKEATGQDRLPPGATTALALETVLVAAALAVSVDDHSEAARLAATALLGYGLGMQAAVARRVARTGISTVVLTTAITGFAEEAPGASDRPGWWRHGLPVLAMALGALVAAVLATTVSHHAALAVGLAAIAVVAGAAWLSGR